MIVIFAVIAVILFENNRHENDIRVNMTTPLINADALDVSFCKNARSAVIIDSKSGAVLYQKNKDARLPMASTTKIMTALAVIENSSPDDIITVSQNAANVEGSSIYLEAGEKITVRDLLYGLMLESGNDAATALAEGVFGSVEKCCEYMNERCREMGLIDTHFSNPHGLDHETHYTTAYELALITKKAMENSFFRELVSTKSYITKGEKSRYFSNHNRLLSRYPKAVGVKTGYTSKSGRCLVSAASAGDGEYIAVTLNDSLDWTNHEQMHNFAFKNFKSYEISKCDSFYLYSGFDKYMPNENVYITTMGESDFTINYKITVYKDYALVEYSTAGTGLGTFYADKITEY